MLDLVLAPSHIYLFNFKICDFIFSTDYSWDLAQWYHRLPQKRKVLSLIPRGVGGRTDYIFNSEKYSTYTEIKGQHFEIR